MATTRLGFLFCDATFFNSTVATNTWLGLKRNQDADYEAFVGEEARKHGVKLSNPNDVKQIQEGGVEPSRCQDGQLYRLVQESSAGSREVPEPSTNKPGPSGKKSGPSETGPGTWSKGGRDELLILYTEIKQRQKKIKWEQVATMYNQTHLQKVTGEQCRLKIKSERDKYDRAEKHNNTSGNSPREIEEILIDAFQPESMVTQTIDSESHKA